MKLLNLALSTLMLSNLSYADKHKGMDEGKHAEKLQKELNLTDDQLAKVKEIRKKFHDDMKGSRDTFKSSKEAFHTALGNPSATKEELTAKHAAFQKLRQEHENRKFNMMLEMRSVLKPDQVKKFQEMKKEKGWGRKGDRGPRR